MEFDLRPANLPNDGWHWPRFITERAPGHPGIFIAADLDNDSTTLAGVTVGELERRALEAARERRLAILVPGDRVLAERTVRVRVDDDPFALESDQFVAVVHWTVEHAHEETGPLEPLLVWPRGNLNVADPTDTLERLGERLTTLLQGSTSGAADLAALNAILLAHTVGFERTVRGLRPEAERTGLLGGLDIPLALSEFDRVLNLAALRGYQQGRLEAELKMKAPALERLARRATNRASQAKGTATRTQWQRPAIEYAIEECARDPEISSSALARMIISANDGEGAKGKKRFGALPQEERLIELVRQWRKDGRLPSRT